MALIKELEAIGFIYYKKSDIAGDAMDNGKLVYTLTKYSSIVVFKNWKGEIRLSFKDCDNEITIPKVINNQQEVIDIIKAISN